MCVCAWEVRHPLPYLPVLLPGCRISERIPRLANWIETRFNVRALAHADTLEAHFLCLRDRMPLSIHVQPSNNTVQVSCGRRPSARDRDVEIYPLSVSGWDPEPPSVMQAEKCNRVHSPPSQVVIRTDNMDMAGEMVQDLANYLGTVDQASVAHFPQAMEEFKKVCRGWRRWRGAGGGGSSVCAGLCVCVCVCAEIWWRAVGDLETLLCFSVYCFET